MRMIRYGDVPTDKLIRYGSLYSQRMPWLGSSGQILDKVSLANFPQPRVVIVADPKDMVWEWYSSIAQARLRTGYEDLYDLMDKVSKMVKYAGYNYNG